MNNIIVVSICERFIGYKKTIMYEFRFSGIFNGHRINKINVYSNVELKVGKQYLLNLSVKELESSSLNTHLLSSRELKKYV